MNINEFLGFFSSNLYLKKIRDKYCVIDSYYLYDEDYNYGVYVELEDIKSVEPLELVPDVYVGGLMEFLLTDEFPNHYMLEESQIEKIEKELEIYGFENLDKICWSNGAYKASEDYARVCQVLRRELKLDFDWEKIAKRYEVILYNAICLLEDECFIHTDILTHLGIDNEEYKNIMNSHNSEQ